MTVLFTRAQAVAHYKSLFKKYPDTFGKWEKVSDEGKEEIGTVIKTPYTGTAS